MVILAKLVIVSIVLWVVYFIIQDYFEWSEIILKVWLYVNLSIIGVIIIYLTLFVWKV